MGNEWRPQGKPQPLNGCGFQRAASRFAYDDQPERADVQRVMHMLREVSPKRKRVYVLIGNEPFDACLERINEVIAWGGEPHVQPYMKLNALEKRPHVRFDWTEQKLRDVARWANGWVYKTAPFSEYNRSLKRTVSDPTYDAQQGLFV